MIGSIRAAVLVVVLGPALSAAAHAQTMYRCGKQYQDRPCDAGEKGRAVGNANPSTGGANPNLHPVCAQRGQDSMKISWAREGGVTQDKAMEGGNRSLVRDVYLKRGSAAEVRSAIEADCQREQEKLAERAATLKAMGIEGAGAPGYGAPAAGPAGVQRTADRQASASADQARQEEARAAAKAERCKSMNQSLQNIREQQRRGGNVSTMEALNREHQSTSREMSAAGC